MRYRIAKSGSWWCVQREAREICRASSWQLAVDWLREHLGEKASLTCTLGA